MGVKDTRPQGNMLERRLERTLVVHIQRTGSSKSLGHHSLIHLVR